MRVTLTALASRAGHFLTKVRNTHDWNNDKPYEGDLQTLNGK